VTTTGYQEIVNILRSSYRVLIVLSDFNQAWIFWTYFTTNPPQCKMSRKSVQWVPGSLGRANGRRDRKKGRQRGRHRNSNIHFWNFANALKNANFSVSYKLCI